MKRNTTLQVVLGSLLLASCTLQKPAKITKNESTENFSYIFFPRTNNLPYGSGGSNGIHANSRKGIVDPNEIISGILLKEKLVRIPEIQPELANKTLVVNYGESGRRDVPIVVGDYEQAIEVTIMFTSAENNKEICSCTAEGSMEPTVADNTRKAISNCLNELFKK